MDSITHRAKEVLRKKILETGAGYTSQDIEVRSEEVCSVIEITGVFQDAKRILLYNSLKSEVQTASFIDRWCESKEIYLPVVVNDRLDFRKYTSGMSFTQSGLGVLEPQGDDLKDYKGVGLVIVPGMAFDRKMNRLGRGKGYYDRFLKQISAPKMGICFDYQLIDSIPTNENDVRMDYIVSENELLW